MNQEYTILDGIEITSLIKAKTAFDIAIDTPKTDMTRDATIQRFEFTFELCWKILKRVLKYKGIIANSPRDVFRESAKVNLIDDPIIWFSFLENRNHLLNFYGELNLEVIYNSLATFKTESRKLVESLRHL